MKRDPDAAEVIGFFLAALLLIAGVVYAGYQVNHYQTVSEGINP